MQEVIFGSFEHVDIPTFGIKNMVAKIDTGAWSGSLHCTEISEKDGRLYFTPLGDASLAQVADNYNIRSVRSSNGQQEDRFAITIQMIVQNKAYDIIITLTDRSSMQREMLIGRKFLIENNILVDVTKGREQDEDMKEDV